MERQSMNPTDPSFRVPQPETMPFGRENIQSFLIILNCYKFYITSAEAFAGRCQANWVEKSFKLHRLIHPHERDVVVVIWLRVSRMFNDSYHLENI